MSVGAGSTSSRPFSANQTNSEQRNQWCGAKSLTSAYVGGHGDQGGGQKSGGLARKRIKTRSFGHAVGITLAGQHVASVCFLLLYFRTDQDTRDIEQVVGQG